MLVFLDLEETLLDEWNSGLFLPRKLDCVRDFLKDNPGSTVGLMSWAVWDDRDKARFEKEFRADLERNLECTFELVWSMDDWANEVFAHFNKKLSRQDLFDMFSKPEVLFALGRTHPLFHNQTVVLVDDAVEHKLTMTSPKNNCTVTLLNVDDMLLGL